jgi:sulfite exporter TauE/SafE
MKENLYYLFASGLVLGSTSCLGLCAPMLLAYVVAHKKSLSQSLLSYAIFSLGKLTSYAFLGILCALGATLIHNPRIAGFADAIYVVMGCFITLIGITTIFYEQKTLSRMCAWFNTGNIRNVGILGLLVGLSPCLPLLGILNYIMLISKTVFDAVLFTLLFGLGTVLSPLLVLVALSAKAAAYLSRKPVFKMIIRVICGAVLVILGGKIILQILLR